PGNIGPSSSLHAATMMPAAPAPISARKRRVERRDTTGLLSLEWSAGYRHGSRRRLLRLVAGVSWSRGVVSVSPLHRRRTASANMFSLKLLGGASIEGPDGPVTGSAVQRRRLGLLAL